MVSAGNRGGFEFLLNYSKSEGIAHLESAAWKKEYGAVWRGAEWLEEELEEEKSGHLVVRIKNWWSDATDPLVLPVLAIRRGGMRRRLVARSRLSSRPRPRSGQLAFAYASE